MQTNPEVEAQVERLTTMRIAEMRTLYVQTLRSDPPKAFGPDLLRRSIAYRIQEKAYGGLDKATSRLLKQLVAGKLVLPRRIKPAPSWCANGRASATGSWSWRTAFPTRVRPMTAFRRSPA